MATLGQTYNLKSFDDAKAFFKGKASTNDASSGGLILSKNLEYVSSEVFEQRIAGLNFLTGTGVTVNNEGGYTDFITKLKVRPEGEFKIAGQNANGNGKITIGAESDAMKVFYKDANSEWSEIELQKASLQNINLVSRYLSAHDTKYKEEIDKIGFLGESGISTGLLNFGGFTATAATKTFANSNSAEMYAVLKDMVNTQRSSVFNDIMFSCDKVALHQDTFNIINGTPFDIGTATGMTVRQYAEATLGVTFVITNKALISGVKRMVAYSSNRMAMQMRIPVPLQISNTDQRGFKYYIESMFGIGGLDVIENASGYIVTGV